MFERLARLGKDLRHFDDVMRRARELARVQTLERDQLRALQERKLRSLLEYAVRHSAFYARHYRGLDVSRCALDELPTLTKNDLRTHFEEIVTAPEVTTAAVREYLEDETTVSRPFLGRYLVAYSSGTTGHKTYCVHDQASLNELVALMFARQTFTRRPTQAERSRLFMRAVFGRRRHKTAMIVVPGHVASNTLAHASPRFHNLFAELRILPSTQPIHALVERLNEFQPDTLMTYASVLHELAHEKLAGRLRLPLDSPVASLYSGGEPLTDATRNAAREAWGLEITDSYQMSECLMVARSDGDYDGLYLMSDFCMLEAVDDQGRQVPEGQIGQKVLITNLTNRIQPIIRYEVTDLTGYAASAPKPGWPFPKLLPIQGRSNDLFLVPDGRGGLERIVPFRFGFLFAMDGLRQFQFVQTAFDRAVFRYVPFEGREQETARAVRAAFDAKLPELGLAGRLSVGFEAVQEISRQVGKLRQFESRVSLRDGDARAAAPRASSDESALLTTTT